MEKRATYFFVPGFHLSLLSKIPVMPDPKYYFLKLNPPRASFSVDMSEAERAVMVQHVQYWAPYVQDGTVLVLGPVADPKGGFGMAVVGVPDETTVYELMAKDPARSICSYEFYPMPRVSRK